MNLLITPLTPRWAGITISSICAILPLLSGCELGAATDKAVYYQSGETNTETHQTYSASNTDESGVYVTDSGIFTLSDSTITTTGETSDSEKSSKYGLNAGILTDSASTITISNSTVTTSGTGANGLFATGSGTSIIMSNGTIKTTGQYAHGIDATYSGSIKLTDVTVTTTGDYSSVIATDYGSGTVSVDGGIITASGAVAAGIYSTGVVTVSNASIISSAYYGALLDRDGSVTLKNTSLTSAKSGFIAYNSTSDTYAATATINGGSITAQGGDAFLVSGTTASITVKGAVTLSASTGYIVNAVNYGFATFTADGETLNGSLISDSTSSISATLKNGTTLTGYIKSAALTLDSTSTWNVTATSHLTGLTETDGTGSDALANINSNGRNVYYDSSLATNGWLGGATYALNGGGSLIPE